MVAMKINKGTWVLIGVVVGAVLTIYLSVSVIPKAMVTLTKAAPSQKVSLGDSYFLAEKIQAKADGVDQTKVNVFVMDNKGMGVMEKSVSIESDESTLVIEPIKATTDKDGKASFSIKFSQEKVVKVRALVEGVEIPQQVSLIFRNY